MYEYGIRPSTSAGAAISFHAGNRPRKPSTQWGENRPLWLFRFEIVFRLVTFCPPPGHLLPGAFQEQHRPAVGGVEAARHLPPLRAEVGQGGHGGGRRRHRHNLVLPGLRDFTYAQWFGRSEVGWVDQADAQRREIRGG